MSDDTIVSLAEWRHRRFAPPRAAQPVLSRATRRTVQALQVSEQHERLVGENAFDAFRLQLQIGLFAERLALGLAVTGALVLAGWLAWGRMADLSGLAP